MLSGRKGAAQPAARARPEAFAAVGVSDDEEVEDEDASLAEEDNDSAGEGSESDEADKQTQKYRAPKMLAVEYTGDKVRCRRLFACTSSVPGMMQLEQMWS